MKTLVCYGDSNTYGTPPMRAFGEGRRYGPEERWPGILRTTLGSGWSVVEEGLPGRSTVHDDPIEGAHKNGLKLLPALLESQRPIDLMTIMLGTNDLKARFCVPAEDVALSIELLVSAILASPSGRDGRPPKVLLIAPVPIREVGLLGPMFGGGAEKSHALGALYAAVAKRLGVAFLDAGTIAETDPAEGIHLALDQHAAIAKAVHAALVTIGL